MPPRMTRDPADEQLPDFAAANFRRQRAKLINDANNNITNDSEAIEYMTELWEERKSRRMAAWEAQLLREAKRVLRNTPG